MPIKLVSQCYICKRWFPTRNGMLSHASQKHPKEYAHLKEANHA